VQALLVAGRRADALAAAVDAQLWPLALLLAQGMGERKAGEVAAAMAWGLLRPGAPLRTFALLLAGRADLAAELGGAAAAAAAGAAAGGAAPVFVRSPYGIPPPAPFGAAPPPGMNAYQQQPHAVAAFPAAAPAPLQPAFPSGGGAGGAASSGGLHDWREHVAIVAANRTPGDVEVLVRLGDRLWSEGGQVGARRFWGRGRPRLGGFGVTILQTHFACPSYDRTFPYTQSTPTS
jgi:hypothetical protein